MKMPQAIDFCDECNALYALIEPLPEPMLDEPTLFKRWTINDILAHLHYSDYLANLSLTDEDQFVQVYAKFKQIRESSSMVPATYQMLNGLKGRDLLATWHDFYLNMTENFADADPKRRVKWVGPSMSVRSSITARLMETWAHGQEVYDLLGVERIDTDRIKNIAILGINTFGWTFTNRGLTVPENMPCVELTAPSGEIWQWNDGDESNNNQIKGSATEFCQVVTQVRNIADTQLDVSGEIAERWMSIAQCFAGIAQDPPAPGTRYKQ